MADLILTQQNETRVRGGRDAFPITNTEVLYAGGLVQLSAGYAADWDDAGAGSTFLGVCIGGETHGSTATVARLNGFTGSTGITPVPEVFIDTSGVILTHLDSINGTPTQAKVGDLIYGGTGNTDDLDLQASGNTDPIGVLWRFRTATDCDVMLFTPTEFLAQQTA